MRQARHHCYDKKGLAAIGHEMASTTLSLQMPGPEPHPRSSFAVSSGFGSNAFSDFGRKSQVARRNEIREPYAIGGQEKLVAVAMHLNRANHEYDGTAVARTDVPGRCFSRREMNMLPSTRLESAITD